MSLNLKKTKSLVTAKDFDKFFLKNLQNPTDSKIKNATDGLQKAYPKGLESYLDEQLVQFSCLLNDKCSGINVAEIFGCISLGKSNGCPCFQILILHCESTAAWCAAIDLWKDRSQN